MNEKTIEATIYEMQEGEITQIKHNNNIYKLLKQDKRKIKRK